MAITKIHPIKKTLNLAIDYIIKDEKTEQSHFVSSYCCEPETAHIKFMMTRKDAETKGTVLARHLIQSFLPDETSPEQAHSIGLELCQRVLKNEYEYVLATHIDKGHIHNHIIFNNVNMRTKKCYQSNKRSYHKIRNISDMLCKENNLIVIDEHYESFKRKYKTKGKSWYEIQHHSKGSSWKSKLQFDIDRVISQAKDWEDFLSRMSKAEYEIKHGKHIAFRYKDKARFTRSKIIGEDYTEEIIKKRIATKILTQKKKTLNPLNKLIDISTNEKIKSSKGYEIWARKHNLKAIASTVVKLRDEGLKSLTQLDEKIQEKSDYRQDLLDKIKVIESKMQELSELMEHAHTIKQYKEIYKYHKENPNDRSYENEYRSEITVYKRAATEVLKYSKKIPNTKTLLEKLNILADEKSKLMTEYKKSKIDLDTLYAMRKNFEIYDDNSKALRQYQNSKSR